MKIRHLLLALMLGSGLGVSPGSAHAALIAFRVDVEVDNGSGFVSKGTATAGGPILDVFMGGGDTIRFTVGLATTPSAAVTIYQTTVLADDPTEMDYIVGSGVELSGLNFASGFDPDDEFTDGFPGAGTIESDLNPSGLAAVDFYSVEYVVPPSLLINPSGVDFSVSGIFSTVGFVDSAAGGTAQVRIFTPEPSSMLLLGSGLALLAGLGRGRNGRP